MISEIAGGGLLARSSNSLTNQMKQRQRLQDRASREVDPTAVFLHNYDAFMRLIEGICCAHGFVFADSPHLAMKSVVSALLPEVDPMSLRRLTDTRHEAKKRGSVPSEWASVFLADLETQIVEHSSVKTLFE